MNFCAGDGTVAPAEYGVPTDPTVHHWAGNREVIPCSALACSTCGCAVRWADGARFDSSRGGLKALYALSEPFASPAVDGPGGSVRLYFCRCAWFDCYTTMGLFLRHEVWRIGLPTSWSCAGHPVDG